LSELPAANALAFLLCLRQSERKLVILTNANRIAKI
jgi:hypothetical protein